MYSSGSVVCGVECGVVSWGLALPFPLGLHVLIVYIVYRIEFENKTKRDVVT